MRPALPLAAALIVLAGCASAPNVESPATPLAYSSMTFTPAGAPPGQTPAPPVAATARVEASYDLDAALLAEWKRAGFSDAVVAKHREEVAEAMAWDIATSGIFQRMISNSTEGQPDFLVKIHGTRGQAKTDVTITLIDARTGSPVCTLTNGVTGSGRVSKEVAIVLAMLKPKLRAAVETQARQNALNAEIAALKTASLADLLTASDPIAAVATARNHALVAAKNQELPRILREWTADQLAALVVKTEQTILDLNHASEVAKDRAQQATAGNADPQLVEELRGLAISYRERIELLKPILAAVKEEIANRNR